jgi:glycosyltransferase involved in cell wall biosynthesis
MILSSSLPEDPLVTVYVVNRNYGRFLKRAIESVLNQDYQPLEIIVVDDASEDESEEVLKDFSSDSDSSIRIIRQSSNRGLTVCCNTAIRASKGEFVMRLDADDYLEPSAVRKMADALAAEPTAVLVFPDYWEVDSRDAVIRRVQRHDFSALESLSELPAHGACTMVRREFLDRFGGYDESINRQDGLDLWLSVGPGDRVLNIGEPLFNYRQHGKNLTRDERSLLQARAKLIAKHVDKKGLAPPRVLCVVPVRGQVVDPGSLPLAMLGDRPLIEWTVDEALACSGVDAVVVSSPDPVVRNHIEQRYGSRVSAHNRRVDLAGLNVDLVDTFNQVLTDELRSGYRYDALLVLTVESPFRTAMFMQQAVDVMQLFGSDAVVAVRHEDEEFYRHDGLGLCPVRDDHRLRRERDDMFRYCGGMRLIKLAPVNDSNSDDHLSIDGSALRNVNHVLLDQLSGFVIHSELDWEIAQHLAITAVRGQVRVG